MIDVDALVGEVVRRLAPAIADELALREVGGALPGEPWRLCSLEEACERLRRSERQVRGWVKSGELAVVRLDGGALAFDVDDLKAFARSRRVGGSELLTSGWQDSPDSRRGAASSTTRPARDRRVPSG